jgi:hypothetical protein
MSPYQPLTRPYLLLGPASSRRAVKYLCKWRGLPYCDATYETGPDLQRFGLASHMVEFEVGPLTRTSGLCQVAGWCWFQWPL